MDSYQKEFEVRSNESAYWHNKSLDLFVSAKTLWKAMEDSKHLEISCLSTYKMLMGVSFELLFKSHCIGLGVAVETNHNLPALAKRAEVATTKDENKILTILSDYIVWEGRYPVPKKVGQLKHHWENEAQVTRNSKKVGQLTLSTLNEELDLGSLSKIWRKHSDMYIAKYS